MRDDDTGEEIQCPYCGATDDCSHLLALIDLNFPECFGYAYERYHELGEVIKDAFRTQIRSGASRKKSWRDPEVTEMWGYVMDSYSPSNEEMFLDPYVLSRFVASLLNDAGAVEHTGTDDPGVPGFASSVSVLHAKHPKSVFDKALLNLKRRLKPRRGRTRLTRIAKPQRMKTR